MLPYLGLEVQERIAASMLNDYSIMTEMWDENRFSVNRAKEGLRIASRFT